MLKCVRTCSTTIFHILTNDIIVCGVDVAVAVVVFKPPYYSRRVWHGVSCSVAWPTLPAMEMRLAWCNRDL